MPIRSMAVPPALRRRRAWRRFPPVRVYKVVRQIIDHPSNRNRRVRALAAAVRWQVRSRLSPKPLDVAVWGEMSLRCYPRSNSASNVIYFTSDHDPAEMSVIRAIVHAGDEVVDAGANIGVYTLFLAHLVGATGRVVAVEPSPRSVDRLTENVRRNGLGQVDIVGAAVGAEEGTASIGTTSDVSNSLVTVPGDREVVPVPVVTLDSLANRPTFLKIDVEGYEMEVLKGATSVMSHMPAIQIELTEHLLVRMGTSGAAITQHLQDAGYRTGFPAIVEGRVQLVAEPPRRNPNLIAIRPDRWDEIAAQLSN